MEILTGYNKFLKLDPNDLKDIGNGVGTEGDVYSYKDMAIKIYRPNSKKQKLSEEAVKKMIRINTERILLPKNPIYSNLGDGTFYFNGYSTQLVNNIKNKKELINLDGDNLYKELQKLEEDINILSDNKIIVGDFWNSENLVYNGNLYYVDPGSYEFHVDSSFNEIYDENMEKLGVSLYSNLFCLEGNLDYILAQLCNIVDIDINTIDKHTKQYVALSLIRKRYGNDYCKRFLNSGKRNYLEYLKYVIEEYGSILNYKYYILKEYMNNPKIREEQVRLLRKIIK